MADTNMSPIDWAKRPLQRYANFKDRAPRAEYWWFYLAYIVALFVAMLIDGALGFGGEGGMGVGPLYILLALGLIIPSIAVTVRRLHDTNRSGWWILLPVLPYAIVIAMMLTAGAAGSPTGMLAGAGLGMILVFAAVIAFIIFMILPGTKGPNRFGPDPYGEDVEKVFA